MEASVHERRRKPDGSAPARGAEPDAGTRELSDAECWQILGQAGIGHLALRAYPVGVDIMPIDYLITGRLLFFRSGPGTKLKDLVYHPYVAVQVERLQGERWFSVVLKGSARRLSHDREIEESGILGLSPTQPGEKFNYVRIEPDAITGRTFLAT
jgi:hypothetical protein